MTKSPVNSISDVKNKKIRSVQNPIHVEAFKAFGANATPLVYNELYGALQAGVVDGADAANTNYWAQKFYEVAPNWALVSWLIYTAPVVMSEKTFQGLPKDIQTALEKAGAEPPPGSGSSRSRARGRYSSKLRPRACKSRRRIASRSARPPRGSTKRC
jgi:TRAP-type C4-dicarboxylate transport system substrate-binding protein